MKKLVLTLLLIGAVLIPLAFAADKTITQLPAVTTPAGGDEFPMMQSGTTKKATLTQIRNFALPGFNEIKDGTNASLAAVCAAGCSITSSGGTIQATELRSSGSSTWMVTIDAQSSQDGLMSCTTGTCTTPYTIVTTIGNPGSDTNIPTEQAVRESLLTVEVDGHVSGSLTAAQVSSTIIYNTGMGGADVALLLPTAAAGYGFIATVYTAQSFKWGVQAGTNDKIYLIAADGTVATGSNNGYARMTAAVLGQSFACWTFKTDAYDWMCKAISIAGSTFAAN